MTVHIETTSVEQNPSRWRRFLASLSAIEEAMNYDPQADTAATIRHLWQKAAQLDIRVNELEGRDQRILASVVTDLVDGR